MSKKIKEKKQKKEKAEKKERHNPIRVVKNLWFMLQFVFKYTPGYAVITVVEALGRGASHVIGILFTKYIFDAIEAGTDFGEVLFWILLVTGYNAAFELFNKWRYDVFVPRVKLTLHETIQTELYKKARELDQSCYDDPEFYNDFIWAIRESDGRVANIVECFSIMINRVTSSAAVLGLLASMDPVVTLILLVTVILGFVVKSILNKIAYKHNVEANPIWRKVGYFRRVFYMPDYAKELRCGGIAEHLQNEYQKTNNQLIACSKKYQKKYLFLWILSDLLVYLLPSVGLTS